MKKRKLWKRNLRKIPLNIRTKVNSFSKDECVASCAVRIKFVDIQLGLFEHLNIRWIDNKPKHPDKIMPHPSAGKYSRMNRFGCKIVYRNKPKTTKTWSIEAPNYGDWTKGTHEVEFEKLVYQRDFVAPKLVNIIVKHVGDDIQKQASIFTFTVDEVLDRTTDDFEEQLLFNLNILQENTGNHDVFESDVSRDDYLKTLYVNWVILPPGEREDTIDKIFSGIKNDNPRLRARLMERYDFLRSFSPRNYVLGVSGFQNYFGAQFADDLVVFENIEYGNAIYVLFDDWEELSKKTRTELLSSTTHDVVRIPHTKTWKSRLQRLLLEELLKKKNDA